MKNIKNKQFTIFFMNGLLSSGQTIWGIAMPGRAFLIRSIQKTYFIDRNTHAHIYEDD
jgi:hypothetical protein